MYEIEDMLHSKYWAGKNGGKNRIKFITAYMRLEENVLGLEMTIATVLRKYHFKYVSNSVSATVFSDSKYLKSWAHSSKKREDKS